MEKEIKHYIDTDVVEQLMRMRGLDAKKLAELMDISQHTLKRLLNKTDQSNVTLVKVFNLARALGVGIADILVAEV